VRTVRYFPAQGYPTPSRVMIVEIESNVESDIPPFPSDPLFGVDQPQMPVSGEVYLPIGGSVLIGLGSLSPSAC
jgi:hypothetical protein